MNKRIRPDERYRDAMARVLAGEQFPDFSLPKAPKSKAIATLSYDAALLPEVNDHEVRLRLARLPYSTMLAALRIGAEAILGRAPRTYEVLHAIGRMSLTDANLAQRIALAWSLQGRIGDAGASA